MTQAQPIHRVRPSGVYKTVRSKPLAGVQDDAASRVFGRHGRTAEPGVINLSLGSLRDIPSLARLWGRVADQAPNLLFGVDSYPGTQGPHSLLERLAELWAEERGSTAAPEDFVATHGALDAVGHALACVPAGSPVFFAVPGFDYRLAIARARCRAVPIAWPHGAGLDTFIAALAERLAATDRQAAIIACIPSNPGGISASPAEWERLRELVQRRRAVLIVDDLYRFTSSALDYLDDPDFIVVDSLSKRLGAPGLRFGYAKATGSHLAQIRASMGQTSVGVSSVVAKTAESILRLYLSQPSIAADIRDELGSRRRKVRRALPEQLLQGLQMTDIGFYGCLQTPGVDASTLAERLRERRVLVTAGADLYAALGRQGGPNLDFIRFCLGGDARIEEAFDAIVETYFELSEASDTRLASVGA
jgi:aspartate/methionine/tyrosine aminotransferase